MPKHPPSRTLNVSMDPDVRTRLERAQVLLWGLVSLHGPTPGLIAAVLAAVHGRDMPLEQGPEFELYFELSVLLESAACDRYAAGRSILATLETATMVWEAFQDGLRAGREQATTLAPTRPRPSPAR